MKTLRTAILLLSVLTAWLSAGAYEVREVPTDNIPGPAKVTVAMPAGATSDSDLRYPTVYLLNGHGGDNLSWSKVIDIDSLATAYQTIIVCPAGLNSWYWDSPVDPSMKMESFITADLVKWVDSNYPTDARREQRAVTGLSMGGHGALWLAFRHPDLFGNAGSTSGGVDFTPWPKSWNIPDRLGSYAKNKQRWHDHTVMSLLSTVNPGQVNLIFDCGTEDFFFDVNNKLHAEMNRRNIPHVYLTSSGAHTPQYWHKSIVPQFDFFKSHFDSAKRRKARHVVFIGLDGWAANTYEKSVMPTVKQLAADGALTLSKRSVLPSASAINWASIFMGVPTEVHGYLTWGSQRPDMQQPDGAVKKHGIMPTIFQAIRNQHPEANLALFAEWNGIKHLVDTLSLDHFEQPQLAEMAPKASAYIREHKPELIAVVFDRPDHPGHDNGWGSKKYYEMMTTVDGYIAEIVKAVSDAGIADETVFVITADHGGIETRHGGTSMDEMLSPLVISGANVMPGRSITQLVMSPDITPTIAYILGIEPEEIWTGRPVVSAFSPAVN